MADSLQIRLYSVYLGKSYDLYMILKWFYRLLIILVLCFMLSGFNVLIFPIILFFFTLTIFNVILNRIRKKEKLICTLTETQFILENLKFEKTLELNLNEIKSVTYIIESFQFNLPYRSSSLVASLNRIVIIKTNKKKINLLFLTRSYEDMNSLKNKIKKIGLTQSNVKYEIRYI